jgi:hypothetical protein
MTYTIDVKPPKGRPQDRPTAQALANALAALLPNGTEIQVRVRP